MMNGFQLTPVLKSDEKNKTIPIFALTNLGTAEDRKKRLGLGMSDYLVRADHLPSEVVEKIKSFLE